jgi:uncharacterized protein (DUF1800 family)
MPNPPIKFLSHRSLQQRKNRSIPWHGVFLGVVLSVTLSACGGGEAGPSQASETPTSASIAPASKADAARFLTQATFGPTEAEVDRLMAMTLGAWIDDQFAKPASSLRAHYEKLDADARAAGATSALGQEGVVHAFWKHALSGEDQLRQRVAFALSQIFVISMVDGTVGARENLRGTTGYYDMLADKGLGTYRDLLEGVATHPMMGAYLSHLRNQKADPRTGRVPDENFAREVMQLFSIGLHELNIDGSPRASGGLLIETYDDNDIAGLAKVFTGWSWACPSWPDNNCFFSGSEAGASDPDRTLKPMLGYPQYHSVDSKTFLGKTIAAQSQGDPKASLKEALDTLAAHPNVGPFIARQLIQRFVTSNPSPAYVTAVAEAFNGRAAGARGDMRAVIRAVLLHPEARTMSPQSGKVREPVLKLSAFMRATGHTSDTGNYRLAETDNPGTALGQTPLRSPSVFNFYRPGYLAPGSRSAGLQLLAPELQTVHETSTAGYVNFMRDAIASGVGSSNPAPLNRRDLQASHAPLLALVDRPNELLDTLNLRLMYGSMPEALKTEVASAVSSITIPTLNAAGSNQAAIDTAKRTRLNAALFLVVISPEYQVQK